MDSESRSASGLRNICGHTWTAVFRVKADTKTDTTLVNLSCAGLSWNILIKVQIPLKSLRFVRKLRGSESESFLWSHYFSPCLRGFLHGRPATVSETVSKPVRCRIAAIIWQNLIQTQRCSRSLTYVSGPEFLIQRITDEFKLRAVSAPMGVDFAVAAVPSGLFIGGCLTLLPTRPGFSDYSLGCLTFLACDNLAVKGHGQT